MADQLSICRTITGEAVAVPFRKEIVDAVSITARAPKLVGILATQDAPSREYAQWTARACRAVGLDYELREIGTEGAAGSGEVEEAILSANADSGVDGIMVYYPIFGPRQDSYLQQTVSALKDVEGLHFSWLFALYHNSRYLDPRQLGASQPPQPSSGSEVLQSNMVKAILPCTALAIVKTLEYCLVYNNLLPFGSRAFGRTVTVINRSEVVGRPLAALLANDGARVFSVDLDGIQEFTRRKPPPAGSTRPSYHPYHVVQKTAMSLEDCLAISDVVVAGVPSKAYKVKTAALKEGVVAINFSESKNFEADIKEKASLYCGGIGKVTIAMLQRNLVRLSQYNTAQSLATEAVTKQLEGL